MSSMDESLLPVHECEAQDDDEHLIKVVLVEDPDHAQKTSEEANFTELQNIPVNIEYNVSDESYKTVAADNMAILIEAAMAAEAGFAENASSMPLIQDETVNDKMPSDDDLNDVAAMGGINLAEESKRILESTNRIGTEIRSCDDEYPIPLAAMQARVRAAVARRGMSARPDVARLMVRAVHARLTDLIQRLALIAHHRTDDTLKDDPRYEVSSNVKGQLQFLADVDRAAMKRRAEAERELLMRAARSRSKSDDPELARLKAKALEMQRAEQEELRLREANATALQASAPRKKPRRDPAAAGLDQGASTSTAPEPQPPKPRIKRIGMRDMIFMLENDPATAHSTMLYKCYLK